MSADELVLSKHAIERFLNRVRPTLSSTAAESELARLAELGDIATIPPAWFAERQREKAPRYLIVGDLVLPLQPLGRPDAARRWCAVTCIARGEISDETRRRRNIRRSQSRRRGR